MTPLTRIDPPTHLEPLCYLDAGESTIADARLTLDVIAWRQPIPTGIVWLDRYVSLIGNN